MKYTKLYKNISRRTLLFIVPHFGCASALTSSNQKIFCCAPKRHLRQIILCCGCFFGNPPWWVPAKLKHFVFVSLTVSTASLWVFCGWLLVPGWVCWWWWLWLPSDSLSFGGKGTSFIFFSSFLFNSFSLFLTLTLPFLFVYLVYLFDCCFCCYVVRCLLAMRSILLWRYVSFLNCLFSHHHVSQLPYLHAFSVWLLLMALFCVSLDPFCRILAWLSLSLMLLVTFCRLSVVRFGFLPLLLVVHFPWSALMPYFLSRTFLCLIAESSVMGSPCLLSLVLSSTVSSIRRKVTFRPVVLPFVSHPPFIAVWLLFLCWAFWWWIPLVEKTSLFSFFSSPTPVRFAFLPTLPSVCSNHCGQSDIRRISAFDCK